MNMNNWEPRGTWQKLLDVVQPYAAGARRQNFIETFEFPTGVRERFAHARSLSSHQDLLEVESALRDYFQICRLSTGEMVSMPSQVADDLWHEFVLHTRLYATFCDLAFGYFLHHSPAGSMATVDSHTVLYKGMIQAWIEACERQKIDPYNPTRLPRLFALDAKLGVTDGFIYDKDEMAAKALRAKKRREMLNANNADATNAQNPAASNTSAYATASAYNIRSGNSSSANSGGTTNYGGDSSASASGGFAEGVSSFWSHHSSHDGHGGGHGSHGHSDGGGSSHGGHDGGGGGGHSGCGGGGHGGHGCGGGGCGGHGGGH